MITKLPPLFGSSISIPSLSTIPTSIPGNGLVQVPGIVLVTPGIGAIILAPVSVCHHVSTTGHFEEPIFEWYHSQALGLIGSPTVPSNLNDSKSKSSGRFSPNFISVLIAVGAV